MECLLVLEQPATGQACLASLRILPFCSARSSTAHSFFLSTQSRIGPLRQLRFCAAHAASPHSASSPPPPPNALQQATNALTQVLSETGLPHDDALLISSRAPACVQALIGAAGELDQLALWSSDTPAVHVNFQEQVYKVAKTSPGRQIGALIESIGVEQRHISRVCHILASHHLPDLLQKIRFLEELFPDDKDDAISIRTRRMMREMSINVDDGLQKTLSFFEKMEARRGGISMLSVPRKAIPRIIEEFPQVLARNLESDLKPLINYLEEICVSKESMGTVIMCYPSVLLCGSKEELQVRLRKLKKVDVKPKKFGSMVVKYPWILSKSIENNIKDIVTFLVTIKVPKDKIGRSISKCPNLLGSSPEILQLMVQRMNLVGVKSRRLGYVVAHSPQLLLKTPRAFNEVHDFLEGFGIEADDMAKLLMRSPELFASNVPFLEKKIKFLQQYGVPKHRLKHVVLRYPRVLMLSVEGSLKPRMVFFQSMGLSKADIAFMVCGFPPLLGYSVEGVLRPKLDFLENVICLPVREVVMYPRYFSYCLQKKIIPRFRVLKRLNITCELKGMLSRSDDDFAADHFGFTQMLVPPV